MNKSVMKQLIDRFNGSPEKGNGIHHKKLWLAYLKTGEFPFSPADIHNAMQEIICKPENLPKGDKLLTRHKKNKFTYKSNKKPHRPEEALERFIIFSNDQNFYNQFPIGGGKESIDIVIQDDNKSLEFVELKAWESSESPLYALTEALKNLIEYRAIKKFKLEEDDFNGKVNITVLAPSEYFVEFQLIDSSNKILQQRINKTQTLLENFAQVFDTKISFYSIPIAYEKFNKICAELYDQQRLTDQQKGCVTKNNIIPELERSNWMLLASSI